MAHGELCICYVDCNHLVLDMDRYRAFVTTVMNFGLYKRRGVS
jgi:hypothetical protein